jgi:hypothetical protein
VHQREGTRQWRWTGAPTIVIVGVEVGKDARRRDTSFLCDTVDERRTEDVATKELAGGSAADDCACVRSCDDLEE